MRVCKYHCVILTKSSQRTFNQHLPFQSVNSNTRVGCSRCPRLMQKALARRKSIVVVHLLGLNKLYTLSAFIAVFRKASKWPEWYWQYFSADILTHS